jgi:hypothetical protein
VYSWGAGKNGRLGHGSQKNHARPHRVAALQNRALAVACVSQPMIVFKCFDSCFIQGWSHSMAIAAPRTGTFNLFKSKTETPNTSILYT